eukprot:TRINITY_DN7571_c0_g1_i1.p1 TRINITY_DN7571_c0_g1~~TRINITY_DN7571_c0_g1_i1.p1  ORF type:complete len:212 (+),score=35.35 TRINITY_DN7571_c0_g1_i1:49-636(+)
MKANIRVFVVFLNLFIGAISCGIDGGCFALPINPYEIESTSSCVFVDYDFEELKDAPFLLKLGITSKCETEQLMPNRHIAKQFSSEATAFIGTYNGQRYLVSAGHSLSLEVGNGADFTDCWIDTLIAVIGNREVNLPTNMEIINEASPGFNDGRDLAFIPLDNDVLSHIIGIPMVVDWTNEEVKCEVLSFPYFAL